MSSTRRLGRGSVMLAAIGLLAAVWPQPSFGQEAHGEGRSRRYTLITGIRGTAADTQTLYVMDHVGQFVFVFEYSARARKNQFKFRSGADLRLRAAKLLKRRSPGAGVGAGTSQAPALVTGIPGSSPGTQTLYVVDDANGILFAFEYDAGERRLAYQAAVSLRGCSERLQRERVERREREKKKQ